MTSGYAVEPFEYTKDNIELYVEGRYRFWNNDKTLRLYAADSDYDAAVLMLTAPAYHEITKVEFDVTATNLTPDNGTVTGKVWTGSENSVLFEATAGVNVKTITVTYKEITSLTATVTSAGWATFVPKYNVKADNVNAYVVSLADDEVALLEKVTEIPAGTPVLLETEGSYALDVIESATAVDDNCLKVSDGTISADDHVYVLGQKNGNTGFYLWTGEALAKGKVYMQTNTSGARQMLQLVKPGQEETGIATVENVGAEREGIYTLQGVRVAEARKGLYVVGGKKVMFNK